MTTAIFIITSNKHFNHLIWDILSSPAPESTQWRSDCLQPTQFTQLTQGGSKVRRSCQSTIVGAVCAELRHSDRNLRTAWFDKGDFKTGIKKKKNTGWIFIIIWWMCTHTSIIFLILGESSLRCEHYEWLWCEHYKEGQFQRRKDSLVLLTHSL